MLSQWNKTVRPSNNLQTLTREHKLGTTLKQLCLIAASLEGTCAVTNDFKSSPIN